MSDVSNWNTRYQEGNTPWDTGQPSSELMRVVAAESVAPGRAIELGCGTGTNAIWLARQRFEVTAVDFSSLALERARAKAEAAGVDIHFRVADLSVEAELRGPYDFVFDRGCYHVVRRENPEAMLKNLEKLSRSGTVGLFLTGNAREPRDPGPPVVSEQEIRTELGRIFHIVWLQEFRFDQVEEVGVRFLGWSCFVRKA